jgi:hypothetical protein
MSSKAAISWDALTTRVKALLARSNTQTRAHAHTRACTRTPLSPWMCHSRTQFLLSCSDHSSCLVLLPLLMQQELARSEMCANPERVALAEQVCERVVCELAPGDALFFHCNLLHCSAPNIVQDDPRWVRVCVLV